MSDRDNPPHHACDASNAPKQLNATEVVARSSIGVDDNSYRFDRLSDSESQNYPKERFPYMAQIMEAKRNHPDVCSSDDDSDKEDNDKDLSCKEACGTSITSHEYLGRKINDSPAILTPNITEVSLQSPLPCPNIPPKPNRLALQVKYGRRFGVQEMSNLLANWTMKYHPPAELTFDTPEEAERWSILDNLSPRFVRPNPKDLELNHHSDSSDDDSLSLSDDNFVAPVFQLRSLPSDDDSISSSLHDKDNNNAALLLEPNDL